MTDLSADTEREADQRAAWMPEGEAVPLPTQDAVIGAIATVYDPEIPVNIYEMGLIYDVGIEPTGEVAITMTLTSPGCPVAGSLPIEVQTKVESIPGVTAAKIDLVWEPAWNPSMMSEAARLQLGMF